MKRSQRAEQQATNAGLETNDVIEANVLELEIGNQAKSDKSRDNEDRTVSNNEFAKVGALVSKKEVGLTVYSFFYKKRAYFRENDRKEEVPTFWLSREELVADIQGLEADGFEMSDFMIMEMTLGGAQSIASQGGFSGFNVIDGEIMWAVKFDCESPFLHTVAELREHMRTSMLQRLRTVNPGLSEREIVEMCDGFMSSIQIGEQVPIGYGIFEQVEANGASGAVCGK